MEAVVDCFKKLSEYSPGETMKYDGGISQDGRSSNLMTPEYKSWALLLRQLAHY
jgi:hypothetical protein